MARGGRGARGLRLAGQADPRCRGPGHADLSGVLKYGHEDVRNVLERASARETAARVAAGAVAKASDARSGSRCARTCSQIGSVRATPPAWLTAADFDRAEASEVRCLDPERRAAMIAEIEAAKSDRDTLGGITEVRAFGVPPGLGSHVSAGQRLDGRLAAAMLSIQSAKGVEIGDAIRLVRPPRVERPRRDPPRRRARLLPRDRPRRRARGRHHQRRRPGRARDLEAAADADAAAAPASSSAATSRSRRTSSAAT